MRCHRNQITFGEMIEKLEKMPRNFTILFDFVHMQPSGQIHCYRGYYEDLALGYESERKELMTVAQFLPMLKDRLGCTFTGYKGGDYIMTEDTVVWVANPSIRNRIRAAQLFQSVKSSSASAARQHSQH